MKNPRKHGAVLLIGPTGSGKSPLGDQLERDGLAGTPCRHFDFGAHLRRAGTGIDYGLDAAERGVVEAVVRQGALLEPSQFGIAVKILTDFIGKRTSKPAPLLVLNGLPRHRQQAEGLEGLLALRGVVVLRCSADTVLERIRRDSGGDREGRLDDKVDLIRQKLAIYTARTEPLIDYYRTKGVSVCELDVRVHTRSAEMVTRLALDFPL